MRTYILLEYKRDITISKLGDRLVNAATRDRNQDIDTIISVLEQMDPTTNKQYVEWLARQYITNQFRLEDKPRINDVLTKFNQIKNKLAQRDINKYTLHSLEEVIDKEFNVEIPDDVDENTDIPGSKNLYNGPLGRLDVPMTEEASKILGSGTKWCTAANEENMFHEYNDEGPLYIWRDKSGKKYQFHFHEEQFMDARDTPIKHELLTFFRTSHPVISKLFNKYERDCLKDKDGRRLIRYARDVLHDRWPEAEPIIMTNPSNAWYYSSEVIKDRWPEAEPIIMSTAGTAYMYACKVIKGRWPEAEKVISTDPEVAAKYSDKFFEGKWPDADRAIATNPRTAYVHAKTVIQGRWKAGEAAILTSPAYSYYYARDLLNRKRWPEAESIIATDPRSAFEYARDILKGRFLEGEPAILTNVEYTFEYLRSVAGRNWKEGISVIATNAKYAFLYAYNILNGRFPEGEPILKSSPILWKRYNEFLESRK